MRKGFGTQQSLPPLIHILGSKIRASSGLLTDPLKCVRLHPDLSLPIARARSSWASWSADCESACKKDPLLG
jgi:hypothetical protein